MVRKKIAMILCAFLFGALFNFIHIPAGWLLGALTVGILFSMTIGKVKNTDLLFQVGLSIIGVGIGIRIDTSLLFSLKDYILPLLVSIPLTLLTSILLAELLFRNSNLDYKTSIFSCLPGGASEAIGMSKEAGANEQIVAAFHTSRIILFVLCIPFVVGATRQVQTASSESSILSTSVWEVLCVVAIIAISIFVSKLYKIPVGTLLYTMLFGFLANQFIDLGNLAPTLPVFGQVIIGSIIGQKFDLATLKQLMQLGMLGSKILLLLFGSSLVIAFIFSLITDLSYASSVLGTVPAGAPEMASTAFALHLDPSIIVALQTLRLLTVVLLLPLIMPFAEKRESLFQKKESV